MLYREIIAVCSQIHTKHINKLCGQNAELLNVKLVVHIVTTGLHRVKIDWRSKNRLVIKWVLMTVYKDIKLSLYTPRRRMEEADIQLHAF
jgi:hypothetical protein